MANASVASIYEKFIIDKNGKQVNIAGKVTSFDYYESLRSPNTSALITIVDTGNSVPFNKKYDKQERFGTIYNALPLTGGEKVEIKVKSKLGTLDFTKNFFYVNAISNPSQESKREAIALSLVSPESFINQQATIFDKFGSRISESAKKLLSESLKIPTTRIDVERTVNAYNFMGNTRNPFEILCWLASKAIPYSEVTSFGGTGDPGFFFYQTRDGFKFKSIDSLIRQDPKATYFRTDVLKSGIEDDRNDFKISSFTVSKNQDVLNALKSGVYVSRNLFLNPKTFAYEEVIVELSNDPQKTDNGKTPKSLDKVKFKSSLGKSPEIPSNLVTDFTRTQYHILDVGTLTPSVGGTINHNPKEYQARASLRYNLLFTQIVQMTVPCNPELMAGDVIRCNFEMVTDDKKEVGYMDPTQSGNYLIMDLCHHFDPKRSFTSMTLVRDTYGIYTNKTTI